MIIETFYKDRPAVKVFDNKLEALFLPDDGGKLVSLKIDGCEFLAQREGSKYLRLGVDTNYVESECSAFDDMFPTIDPCSMDNFSYPDHGEVCRSSFEYEITDDTVYLRQDMLSVNAVFSKTAGVENGTLCIKYSIENKNDVTLPYIWAGHIMLAGEEGAKIVSKFTSDDPATVAFGKPPAMEKACVLEKYGANKEYKFYYDDSKTPMECSVCYPKTSRKIDFSFEEDTVKYLGIWMNPGDLNGMYSLAIEPCTAPYDTPVKAEERGKGSYINPKEKIEFTIKISGGKFKDE